MNHESIVLAFFCSIPFLLASMMKKAAKDKFPTLECCILSFGSHFPQRRSDLTEESIPTATPCPRQGVIFGKPREKCMPPLVSPRVLWHSEYGILSAQGKEGCYAV